MIMIVISEFVHARLFSPFLFLMQGGIHIAHRRNILKIIKITFCNSINNQLVATITIY